MKIVSFRLNYLNWKEKGGNEWTKQDEIKLINKIYEMDVEDENMIDWKGLMTNWTRSLDAIA